MAPPPSSSPALYREREGATGRGLAAKENPDWLAAMSVGALGVAAAP